ncbi:hypothetical protein BH23ACT9_BH23ACT9_00960 [soil metagenome]
MTDPTPSGRPPRDDIDDQTFRGGLTGIALVALTTLGLSLAAAVVVAAALLLVG